MTVTPYKKYVNLKKGTRPKSTGSKPNRLPTGTKKLSLCRERFRITCRRGGGRASCTTIPSGRTTARKLFEDLNLLEHIPGGLPSVPPGQLVHLYGNEQPLFKNAGHKPRSRLAFIFQSQIQIEKKQTAKLLICEKKS
jgi:hypothetical protein